LADFNNVWHATSRRSFAHLTLILLLHYLVKSRSRSRRLAVYSNTFILGSACVGSEKHESTNHWKSLLV